jgi:hypothetical protein
MTHTIVETQHPTAPGRFYTVPSGKAYPSVTTVLAEHSRKGIEEWTKKVGVEEATRIKNRAGVWGSTFHDMVERHLKGQDLTEEVQSLNPLDRRGFRTFIPLLKRITGIRLQEGALYSDELRLAGRVDCVADFDKTLSIIDFKTSRKPKVVSYIENYLMQATAYSIMVQERYGWVPKKLVILICVEAHKPQVFTCNPSYYIKPLLKYRDLYEKTHLISTETV